MIQAKPKVKSLEDWKKELNDKELSDARSLFNQSYHSTRQFLDVNEDLALQLKIESIKTIKRRRL